MTISTRTALETWGEPFTHFTGAHRPGIATFVAAAATPRAFVVGTAGSGKSTLLRELADLLIRDGLPVLVPDDSTDIDTVAPSEVLVVDDLHLLDGARIASLRQRCADPNAAIIAASRPWPRSKALAEISGLLERSAPTIVLGRVSRSDVLTYLEDRGRELSSACLDHLFTITGGIAWLVSHALATHDDRHCEDDAGRLEIQQILEARIAHRLDTLDEPLRRLIEQICIGSLDTTELGLDAAEADDLIARGFSEGLLLRNGSPVPVVRSAVRACVPLHRIVELGDRTRGHQADEGELALRQALDAWASVDLDAASGHLDSALACANLTCHDQVVEAAAAVWSARGMMATGSEIHAVRPPGTRASTVKAALAHIGAGATERLEPPLAVGATGSEAPSTLGMALRLLDSGLRASLEQDPSPTALTHLVRASELYTASRATDPLPELPAVIATAVALGAGDVTTAQLVIGSAVAGGQGGTWALRRLLLWQSFVAIQAERPADARRALARSEAVTAPASPRDEMIRQTVLVSIARRYEDLPHLEATWQAARQFVGHIDVDLYTLLPLSSLIDAAARVGDSTTLAPHFTHGLEILRRLGSPPLWSTHLRWAGIQQAILLNRPALLGPHARALVAAAPRNHVAETMAQAGQVWVSVLAGSVDADAVETAARALASAGLAWDGARLAGHGAGRSGDRKSAARLLSCARELHPQDVARTPTPMTQDSPGPPVAGAEGNPLSERELDVARLVLQGKTYAEIGEAIFISPRTVEHHVASIKRRLEATSRSDLIAKLRLTIESPAGGHTELHLQTGRRGETSVATPLLGAMPHLDSGPSPEPPSKSHHQTGDKK